MLAVISPAKSLDFETPAATRKHTEPQFLDDSTRLIGALRRLAPPDVADLMGISSKLAELNVDRYAAWQPPFSRANAKQAVLAFKGDVYLGLEAWRLGERDFTWLQRRLRILSGLYGLLRPLDLIQPYRLEMGVPFAAKRAKNLYEFWGTKLTTALNAELEGHRSRVLVNLASNEYWAAVRADAVEARIVTPIFKDLNRGQYRVLSFFAKRARGAMVRHMTENRIESVKGLQSFSWQGYRYSKADSNADELVFLRDEPPSNAAA